MDIFDFYKIVVRHRLTLVITVILFWGISFGILLTSPDKYEAAITFTVNREGTLRQEDVDYYLYDNFHAIQSAGFVADTIVSSLTSPATVFEIYQRAQLSPPTQNLKKIARVFEAKKDVVSVNVISASTKGKNKEELTKLIVAARDVIKEKINIQNKTSGESGRFEVATNEPVIIKTKLSYTLYSLVGIFAGLILSILAISFQEGLKRKR